MYKMRAVVGVSPPLHFVCVLFLLVALFSSASRVHSPGHCVMYSEEEGLPIVNEGPAHPVDPVRDAESINIIRDVCGPAGVELLGPESSSSSFAAEEPSICCDYSQLVTLKKKITPVDQFLASCPACYKNFISFWCHFTCSPDQSLFLDVDLASTTNSTADPERKLVNDVDFYVPQSFSDPLFDSCRDVKFGSANSPALDLVAPGATDGLSFLTSIGRKGSYNPITINFPDYWSPLPDGVVPFERTNFDCDDSVAGCTCTNCEKSCPTEFPADREHNTCHIGNTSWECVAFIGTLVYGIVVGLIILGGGISVVSRVFGRPGSSVFVVEDSVADETDDKNRPLLDAESSSASYGIDDGVVSTGDHDEFLESEWIVDSFLRRRFFNIGLYCARNVSGVILTTLFIVSVLSHGWYRLQVETKPVNLWADKSSRTLREKNFFDENFAPFWRISQIIVTDSDGAGILTREALNMTWTLQKKIEKLKVPYENTNVTLTDFCVNPLGKACATQSFSGWYKDKERDFYRDINPRDPDNFLSKIKTCVRTPGDVDCLSTSQQPLLPKLVLGGMSRNNLTDWMESTALVVSFVLNGSLDEEYNDAAVAWERAVIDVIKKDQMSFNVKGLNVAFNAESSVEDELSRDATTDIFTIALSYCAMFLYASLALRRRTSLSQIRQNFGVVFVGSRFFLGICGILIVVASVVCSVGILSFFGQKATLIIAEVIPFLVLAVGVDNIFILVNTYDRFCRLGDSRLARHSDASELDSAEAKYERIRIRVAHTLAAVGPSILLSSTCETIAFALGVSVSMPAVSMFSLYAAMSVLFNFLLQATCFVSFLTLDAMRQESNRVDCLPCIQVGRDYEVVESPTESTSGQSVGEMQDASCLEEQFHKNVAPFILHPVSKFFIVIGFLTVLVFVGMLNISKVELGLDQRLALPRDSYLIDYFDAVEDYLEVGAPMYFVFKGVPSGSHSRSGLDMTSLRDQRKICGKFMDCNEWSVANFLEKEYLKNERTDGVGSAIATPAAYWFDDFVTYLNNNGVPCCSITGDRQDCFLDGQGDPDTDGDDVANHNTSCACFKWRDKASHSRSGNYSIPFENFLGETPAGLPTDSGVPSDNARLMQSMKIWLNQIPYDFCPTAGKAAYSTSVSLAEDDNGNTYVKAFVLRTYHQTLRTQKDYIEAYQDAKFIADQMTEKSLGFSVPENPDDAPIFAYSLFYVFFEQYETIWTVAWTLILFALGAIFIVLLVFVGSPLAALAIVGVVAMMVVDLIGAMALYNISLNAVSTVNLVIAVGIGVEFCVHIARTAVLTGSAAKAIAEMGSSVFSGITLTKIIGISVLGFAQSKIFDVFYFRMYTLIVILGAAHGLVLLPVVLDYLLSARSWLQRRFRE